MSRELTTDVPPSGTGAPQKGTNALLMDRLLRGLTGVVLWSVILFVAAGRVGWKRGWIYVYAGRKLGMQN